MRINGLEYHVEDDGDRSAKPLLLLHGFTGSTRSWDGVAAHLSTRYRVIRVDLPGHGQTELPSSVARCSMTSVADDLAALLERMNASPAHVLGYSMGGRLALFLALAHPARVRNLIIESGSPGLATDDERAARRASDEALAERIERHGIDAFVDEWERLPLWRSQAHLPDAVKQHQRAIRLGTDPRGLALSLRGMSTGAQPSLWDALSSLQAPTLFIAGALDQKFVTIAQQMQARVHDGSLAVIADAGHTTHLEQPDEFMRAMAAFLS